MLLIILKPNTWEGRACEDDFRRRSLGGGGGVPGHVEIKYNVNVF